MITDQAAVSVLILIVLMFAMLWLRAKVTPKPDYTDAVNKARDAAPDNIMTTQYQEYVARQDNDFRTRR